MLLCFVCPSDLTVVATQTNAGAYRTPGRSTAGPATAVLEIKQAASSTSVRVEFMRGISWEILWVGVVVPGFDSTGGASTASRTSEFSVELRW